MNKNTFGDEFEHEISEKKYEKTVGQLSSLVNESMKLLGKISSSKSRPTESEVDELIKNLDTIQQEIDVSGLTELLNTDSLAFVSSSTQLCWKELVATIGLIFSQSHWDNYLKNLDQDSANKILAPLGRFVDAMKPIVEATIESDNFYHNLQSQWVKDRQMGETVSVLISSVFEEKHRKKVFEMIVAQEKGDVSEICRRLCFVRSEQIGLFLEFGGETYTKAFEQMIFNALLGPAANPSETGYPTPSSTWLKEISKLDSAKDLVSETFTRAKNWLIDNLDIDLHTICRKKTFLAHEWPAIIGGIIGMEREKKGSTLELSSKYGILNFHRYNTADLIQQIEEDGTDKPYGVVCSALHDHNGAFNNVSKNVHAAKKVLEEAGIGMRFIEAGSKFEMIKTLFALNKKFGDKNKIMFLIINAHGEEKSFTLGRNHSKTRPDGEPVFNEITITDLDATGVKKLEDCFTEKPQVILCSCSTGVEGGIGQSISKKFETNVTAPETPVATIAVVAKMEDNGIPHLDIIYSQKTKRQYQAGVPTENSGLV